MHLQKKERAFYVFGINKGTQGVEKICQYSPKLMTPDPRSRTLGDFDVVLYNRLFCRSYMARLSGFCVIL